MNTRSILLVLSRLQKLWFWHFWAGKSVHSSPRKSALSRLLVVVLENSHRHTNGTK